MTTELGAYIRHNKSGTKYIVLAHAVLKTGKPLEDCHPMVVYFDEDGQVWVRPVEEMTDGRFSISIDGFKPRT